MQFIGYIQAVKGFALVLGPSIGFQLSQIGGYDFLFYFFASLFFIATILIRIVFRPRVDLNSDSLPQTNVYENE